MGDVVLGELLRARGLGDVPTGQPDFWVASSQDERFGEVMTAASLLRRLRASVVYALRPQSLSKQKKAALSAGASYLIVLADDFAATRRIELQPLLPSDALAGDPLRERMTGRPSTLDALLEVIGAHPQILTSLD
jgi:histidyl-tRNA synthetase